MRKVYLITACCFLLFAFAARQESARPRFKLPKGIKASDYTPNNIVIKLKNEHRGAKSAQSLAQTFNLSSEINFTVTPIFPQNSNVDFGTLGNNTEGEVENYFNVRFSGTDDIETVINQVLQNELIEYAEPRYVYSTFDTPNDLSYNLQYSLPLVKAPQAWDLGIDASKVIIGIVDTGSELNHPDLAANLYVNNGDPIDGVDNDADGYVDNYKGWDLCGASVNTMIPDNDPSVKSAAADHGIHVSGIASGVTANGQGIASVARNAKLLVIKASADDVPNSIYYGYEGIKYAADMGAHIINCSWGGLGGGQFGQEMINYAISKGCLIIAAGGNSNNDAPIYPAAYAGVFAVANTNVADKKNSSSNFGSYIDISAPGETILSTTYGGTYGYKTGTSMSAPLVASAAALVKAKYPTLNGEQIGELLRSAADDVDGINISFAKLIGKGRLNVSRALTASPAALRYQQITVNDFGFGNRAAGTEIIVKLSLKNYLMPISNLKVDLTTNSSFAEVLNHNVDAGYFATLQQKDNVVTFKIRLSDYTPDNHQIKFTVHYNGNDGTFSDTETYTTVVALDYINVDVNKVSTTLTSVGRVGYSGTDADGGLGFVYRGDNLLYEAALLIGKSSTQVMNNARANKTPDQDFIKLQIAKANDNKNATFEGTSIFTDGGSASPLGLKVLSRMLAFNNIEYEKFVIVEYEITNTSGVDMQGIYTGLFTDWDLDNSSLNATEFDTENSTAFTYARSNATFPYAGIKLLNLTASPAYYPMSYQLTADFLEDGNFTTAEKFKSLSSGVSSLGIGNSGSNAYDVMYTVGSGPYNIQKNATIKVVYAFLAADSKKDLMLQGVAAQQRYNAYKKAIAPPINYVLKQNYPNNATTYTNVPISLPEKTAVKLNLYDVWGKQVLNLNYGEMEAGTHDLNVDLTKLISGIYTYQLLTPKFKQSKKMLVVK